MRLEQSLEEELLSAWRSLNKKQVTDMICLVYGRHSINIDWHLSDYKNIGQTIGSTNTQMNKIQSLFERSHKTEEETSQQII